MYKSYKAIVNTTVDGTKGVITIVSKERVVLESALLAIARFLVEENKRTSISFCAVIFETEGSWERVLSQEVFSIGVL